MDAGLYTIIYLSTILEIRNYLHISLIYITHIYIQIANHTFYSYEVLLPKSITSQRRHRKKVYSF